MDVQSNHANIWHINFATIKFERTSIENIAVAHFIFLWFVVFGVYANLFILWFLKQMKLWNTPQMDEYFDKPITPCLYPIS